MAENIPNVPGGALPPKKETGKVQPKKETVRINLPPKPSAAPTIKLPTLPPGGPAGGPAGVAAPVAAGPAAAPALHGAPSAPRAVAAPALSTASRPAPPAGAPRAVAAPIGGPSISTLDKVLAIVAAILALAAAVSMGYIWKLELPASSAPSGGAAERASTGAIYLGAIQGPR